MPAEYQDNVFTKTLASSTLEIIGDYGVHFIAVKNTTAGAVTILGTRKLGTIEPDEITLGENESINIIATQGYVLHGLTIDSSASTAQVVAVI